jgi:hypothetical protein
LILQNGRLISLQNLTQGNVLVLTFAGHRISLILGKDEKKVMRAARETVAVSGWC